MWRILLALAIVAVPASAGTAEERESGVALVIGIDGYQTLGKLTTCRNDAREFARALVESGGYAESRVVLLTDDATEPHNRPTLATMRRRITQVARLARPSDPLIIYFSGHGITRDGRGFLVPSDGDAENAISLSWIKDELASSRASSKILIIDACHAGSAAKGVSGIAPSMAAGTPGLVMLLSSAADEVSYPLSAEKRSVFSRYLVEGLEGKADTDGDRRITLPDLHSFVEERLLDWCLETGKTQRPLALPAPLPELALARIPDVPTLSVTAVDAETGEEVAADVYLDGRKVGTAPLSGRRLEKGESYRLEVKADKSKPYTETVRVSRGGVHSITARLEEILMRVPEGFRAAPGTKPEPYTGTGWASEVIHEKTGIEMVFIPAGEFMMGSPSSEEGRDDDEGPRHRVRTTKPFYLGKYEVSNAQYRRFRPDHDSKDYNGLTLNGDDQPAVYVTWADATAFCGWGGDGLRLPSEAEWEYACRAGTTQAYQWGGNPDAGSGWMNGADQAAKRKWSSWTVFSWDDGYAVTSPVGSFKANAWGLYDTHGNVWEWCADRYDDDYYRDSPESDPRGPSSGSRRVLRGGSPGSTNLAYGFRVARTVE